MYTRQNLAKLMNQRAEIDAEIARVRRVAYKEACAEIRGIIRSCGIRPIDLFTAQELAAARVSAYTASALPGADRTRPSHPLKGQKVSPKYRDPETGKTWTGRGSRPKWITDETAARFLVKGESAAAAE